MKRRPSTMCFQRVSIDAKHKDRRELSAGFPKLRNGTVCASLPRSHFPRKDQYGNQSNCDITRLMTPLADEVGRLQDGAEKELQR
ncbi:unnamed protein product [Caenorhabditis nigoni]